MLEYCDIHAHLADARIREELPRILAESRQHGVAAVLACAARPGEWDSIIELAARPGIFGALGVHPFFLEEWHDGLAGLLRAKVSPGSRLPAIGEIGLDFYESRVNAAQQREVLAVQLHVAAEIGVPVIAHNRRSWNDFFAVLKELNLTGLRGVCHHFTGSREVARQVLDAGFHVSFCGPLTYANAHRIKSAASYVPLDRILTETDTPDLPPSGHRGEFSYPWHVRDVAAEIARIKKLTVAEVAGQVLQNFQDMLRIDCAAVSPLIMNS
jgi:TatD DNase family protein